MTNSNAVIFTESICFIRTRSVGRSFNHITVWLPVAKMLPYDYSDFCSEYIHIDVCSGIETQCNLVSKGLNTR